MIVSIGWRTFFSLQHIKSAAYFTRNAATIEKELPQELIASEQHTVLSATVTAALFSSVAFLEATINELYADAQDPTGPLAEMDHDRLTSLDGVWAEKIDRQPILCKYLLFLEALGYPPLEKGSRTWADVRLLIDLRNNLVHYQASWLDAGTADMIRPGALAKSKLITPLRQLPRIPGAAGQRTAGWLSAGTATWAVQAALNFTEIFFENIRVTPTYDHIRQELALV